MGTRGYMAYRYKGKYYRQFIKHDAQPEGYGWGLLRTIPRQPAGLEKWIAKLSKALLDEKTCRKYTGSDSDSEDKDICTDSSWTLGETHVEWTYVIDLDNRVFTVNGALHFKLDNMPPLRASGSKLGFIDYFEDWRQPLPKIPAEHLTSIADLWPELDFDPEKAQQEYSALQLAIVALSEWKTPTWNTLSVAQHVSASLVKTLVCDYSDELALCHYQSIWPKLGIFCWDVVTAAATAHLLCPPVDALPQNDTIYVLDTIDPVNCAIPQPYSSTHYYLAHKKTMIMGRFHWFRGCLITFCPRLDVPAYMMHQVVQMVQALRKNDRAQGVGIIMSGWHIVAVMVDGPNVRHSSVLDLHDGKELRDGALLLMHLLDLTFASPKVPWLRPVSYDTHPPPALPHDVLCQIIHSTDFDTYIRLSMVSRYFRSICLAQPRIGYHTLLSYEGVSPNSEPVFRVRSIDSTDSKLAILKRVESPISNPRRASPLWNYRFKRYHCKPVAKPGLVGMFQSHLTGTRPCDPTPTEVTQTSLPPRPRLKPISFSEITDRDKYHNIRIQVLDGVWRMIEESEEFKVQMDGSPSE